MPAKNGPTGVEVDGHAQQKKIRKFLETCGCPVPEGASEEDIDAIAIAFIQKSFPNLNLSLSPESSMQVVNMICKRFSNGAAKQVLDGVLIKLEEQLHSISDLETALDLAQELRGLSINPAGVTDFMLRNRKLTDSMEFSNLSDAVVRVIKAASASQNVVLPRVLMLATKNELLNEAKDFDVLCKLLETGIYPTPNVFSQLRDMADEQLEREFLQMLHERMDLIRTDEKINTDDAIDLELYYNYLNVPISYEQFGNMMKAISDDEIPPIPPHFTPFRISTRGVEVLTEDIDHEATKGILDGLSEASRVESARSFLQGLPHMSKKEMPVDKKYEMMGSISIALGDKMEKAGMVEETLSSPFNETNVLSETEKILKLNPSYQKITWLNYARFALGQFIKKGEELMKDSKLVSDERNMVLANVAKAKELGGKCVDAFMADLDPVMDNFTEDPEGYKHIYVIHDMLMEFEFKSRHSEKDKEQYRRISDAAYTVSFARVEALSDEDIEDVLRTASIHFFRAGVNTPGAKKKLWECLLHQTLLNSPAIAEDVTSGRTEVALQAAHGLYQEYISDQLAKNLEQEQYLSDDFGSFLREAILAEVKDVVGRLRGYIGGVGKQLRKKGQSDELKMQFQRFKDSLTKKIEEYERGAQKRQERGREFSSPAYAIKMLAGSCKYHSTDNRTINKLSKIPDLSEFEKKLMENLQQNVAACAQLLGLPQELLSRSGMAYAPNAGYDAVEEGFAEAMNILSKLVDKDLPEYSKYMKERKAMEAEHIMEKTRRKNEIYSDYLEELEEEGLDYDPAEFHQRARPVVKQIDQEYSVKYKSLRKAFEAEMGDSFKLVTQAQRMRDRLEDLHGALSPLDEVKQEALAPVTTQLDKLTYRDLGKDEFEFIPSKKRGDMIKGWVTGDCSKNASHGRQLCNKGFVNYRVYKTVNGERAWVGNVYVLDAYWGSSEKAGQPVILFDAIQINRSTQINSNLYVQGIIDAFAKIAQHNNYAFITSNQIHTTVADYLVSNTPQIREAYIRLTEENANLPKDGAHVGISDESAKKTFQALNIGGQTFKVLWSHPDTEPVVDLQELKELLGQAVDEEVITSLLKKAETDPFTFGLNFQSQRGYEHLQRLQSDPAKLKLYVTLMDRYFGYRAAQAILANEADLELLGQFDQLGEDYAELALQFLYSGRRAVHFFLRDVLTATKDADEETKALYKKLLYNQTILRPEQIEEVKPLYGSFDKIEAGSLLLSTYRRCSNFGLSGMQKLAELIDAGSLGTDDKFILNELTNSTFLTEGYDLERVVTSLKRFSEFMPSDTSAVLDPSYLAILLRVRTFKDPEELERFVDAFDVGEVLQDDEKNAILGYAGKIIYDRRHNQFTPLGDVFKVMLAADLFERQHGDSDQKKQQNLFNTKAIFTRLMTDPDSLPDFLAMMENLKTCGRLEERIVLLGHLLSRKASSKKLALISGVDDQDIEKMYFYLANLDNAMIEDDETLETLHAKFIREKYEESGVERLKNIDQLIKTGEDFGFVKKGQESILQSFFDLSNLASMDHVQEGETERIKKKDLDEGVPTGYAGLAEFMGDQRSVFTLPYHK